MLQDAVQVFSKKNEQSPKQHVTVSKPDIALEESGNSIKVASAVQPITDERTKQEEKGTRGNFPQGYMPFPQGQINFSQEQKLILEGLEQNTEGDILPKKNQFAKHWFLTICLLLNPQRWK